MKNYFTLSFYKDSLVFVGSMLISALITAPFEGIQGSIAWTSFAVLCTYSLYNAKPNESNFFYVFFWMALVLLSTYIGQWLKLSWGFYLFLFVITYCYYFYFGRDPVFDRAIRFIILLSTMGTTLPDLTNGLPIGSAVGTLTALTVCHYLTRKNYDLNAFKQGIFTHSLFKLNTNIIPRATIYSLGMFACLLIPTYFGIDKIYWASLTFIMVMTPKADAVIHNTFLRFVGSIAAVILLYGVFQIPHIHDFPISISTIVLIALFVFSFILPLCFGHNFAIVTFGVTCYSLTLVELAGFWHDPTYTILIDRVIETMIGGTVAIIVSVLLKLMRRENAQPTT